MEFLSDDPTWPAAALGLMALIFLVMLKVTQQGKYLIYAGIAGLVLLVLLAVEWVWVTDNERIESTIYGLANAVAHSDGERAADFLDTDCRLEPSPNPANIMERIVSARFAGPVTRERLVAELPRYKFDWVKITNLHTHAGAMTRMGTAEFVVRMSGMQIDPSPAGIMTTGMGWTVGLREVQPGEWKVTRLTPGRQRGGD